MSESIYRQRLADLAASGSSSLNGDQAKEIVEFVQHADAAGEPWAYEVIDRWSRVGAQGDYNKAFKACNSVTVYTARGKKRKTTAYSRPKRSPESGEIVGYQMQTWWGMGRMEIAELERDLAIQVDQVADSLEQVRALAAAMDRHPDCATAADAWVADGRSLDEIDLSEVAS